MTQFSRRTFITGLLAGSVVACSPVITRVERPTMPEGFAPPNTQGRNPVVHLLNRASYGMRPGMVQQVENMGTADWLQQQLDYDTIPDRGVNLRLRRYDTLTMNSADLLSFSRLPDRHMLADELATATLIRAVFSERQLYELLVGFWSDHFSIYHYKNEVPNLKTVDDREVIRPHALGNFADMLRASAHSPAMLVYLDNVQNEKSHPNENYAREIMELHTLGVDGGYTEDDIKEVARCFTGWSVNENGEFVFISDWHDYDEKRVLGETIRSEDGKSDGDRVLEILLAHPSTPQFIATKLVRRFVADDPPAAMVDSVASTLRGTQGNIKAAVRAIFEHPDFATAPPKLKRPFELLVSLLRVTNANYNGNKDLLQRLEAMGHRPFDYPTPDGYPDTAQSWTGSLLNRWNLVIDAISGSLPGVTIDMQPFYDLAQADGDAVAYMAAAFTGHAITTQDRQAIDIFIEEQNAGEQLLRTAGAVLVSPAFQWR
ncbi:MAG: DUF1800 domain-containing protein [Chloroflexota bacterium]